MLGRGIVPADIIPIRVRRGWEFSAFQKNYSLWVCFAEQVPQQGTYI